LAATAAAQPIKVVQTLAGAYTSGTKITIAGSNEFTPATDGYNMDVYYDGQLLRAGAGNDYTEDAAGDGVALLFGQHNNETANLTFIIRK
jgi:hypothetical protein